LRERKSHMIMYHGSPEQFDRFDLSRAGAGTGIKYGFGVYLTESERSAVHYSNPRALKGEKAPAHYLYTVEIPDLTAENHLMSKLSTGQWYASRNCSYITTCSDELLDELGVRGIVERPMRSLAEECRATK